LPPAPRGHQLQAFANIAEGTWPGKKTFLSDGAIATRYLLGKIGSDAGHVVASGAADEPIGIITDEAGAAEDAVNVNLFGSAADTQLMVGAEAIAAGADVYTAAGGKVQDEPGATGTFWLVGRALAACGGDGQLVQVEPVKPIKVVVIAALTSTNGTAGAAADLTALKAEAEKIGDDVRALGAALATPALVKVLA
jgi:hypothetical protein